MILVILAIILCCAVGASADDFVGERTDTPGTYTRYLTSLDPSVVVAASNEVLHVVPPEQVASQQLINIGLPYASPPVQPSVEVKYRKVVNKLVVEMDAAEKQQVDNVANAQAALVQQYQDEKTKDMCKEDLLASISSFLNNRKTNKLQAITDMQKAFQDQIDEMSVVNLTVAKDMFTKANVNMHDAVRADMTDEYVLFENVARCLLAVRKTGR